MERTTLDGTWTVEAVTGPDESERHRHPVEAVVPGCVHTDLLRAGRVPTRSTATTRPRRSGSATPSGATAAPSSGVPGRDPPRPRRRRTRHPGHHRGERHRRRDDGEPAPRVPVPRRAPAPAGHERGRRHLRRPGPRRRAPVRPARRRAPHVNHHPYNALRKNASNFGWDWGIDVATSGIWRSIGIESWSGVRIAAVRPLVDLDGTTGVLTAHVDVEHAGSTGAFAQAIGSAPVTSAGGDGTVGLEARITVAPHRASAASAGSDTVPPGRTASRPVVDGSVLDQSVTVRLEVPDVAVWWPRGEGDQPLYDVRVAVGDDVWTGRVGFRTVTLDTAADAGGAPSCSG
ncbi:hypothetical protein P9139_11655 [Curtobacterium flaccumfaciens]|nr:hypothetical protein P9139_11655 [Curtobacterium flaccumfaciens]